MKLGRWFRALDPIRGILNADASRELVIQRVIEKCRNGSIEAASCPRRNMSNNLSPRPGIAGINWLRIRGYCEGSKPKGER